MKKNFKKLITTILVCIIIIGIALIVYADNNYTCTLTVTQDKETIAPEETVTFEFKATNIQAGNGIVMFSTTIDNDTTDILDKFDVTAVTGDSQGIWSGAENIDGVIFIKRKDYEPSSDDTVVARITLKPKSTTPEGTYTINFIENKFTTDDYTEFKVSDISKNIEIKASSGGNSSTGGSSSSGSSSSGGNSSTGGSSSSGSSSSGGNSSTGGSSSSGSSSSGGNSSTGGSSSSGSSSSGDNSSTGGSSSSGSSSNGTSSSGDNSYTGGSSSSGSSSSGNSSSIGGSSLSGSSSSGSNSSTGGSSSTSGTSSTSTSKEAVSSSKSNAKLPYAGETSVFPIVLIIIALIIMSICFFAKYKWLNI